MNKYSEKFNRLFEWAKKWKFEIISILIIVIIAVLGAWDAYSCVPRFIGDGRPITLEYLLGSLGAITTIYLVWRRTKGQEEQIKIQTEQIKKQEEQIAIQIKKEVDDRFTTAVNLLGSSESSARTGAIYSLYHQAVDDEKYHRQIVQILCSHIRSKTQEPKYQKQHKNRPSNEIQTTIDLLFRETENKGLYPHFRQHFPDEKLSPDYFEQTLPNANLSCAYCVGVDFRKADCQEANFEGADCQGANFEEAYCQGANFKEAYCQGAYFVGAHCQGANFEWVHCQGAYLRKAHCEGAYFWGACCQGANFEGAHCEGANFGIAYCEGANFSRASCRGAYFGGACCQGTNFGGAYCEGAYESNLDALLEYRIGKDTELKKLILEGALSEQSIDDIEKAAPYCLSYWYTEMQKIIEENKGKKEKRGTPDGIIPGVLEDSDGELRKIIKLLKEIKERNAT